MVAARRKRYDIRRAFRAMQALYKDPNDIPRVFEIVDALPGYALQRGVKRLRRSEIGTRLLTEQPNMAALLADRALLGSMPRNSLAAGYLSFMSEEQLTPKGLVEADSMARAQEQSKQPEEEFLWQYLRDTHDLWHVVTGYKGDLLGEPSLQAFTYAQSGIPGSGFIVFMVYLQAPAQLRRMIVEGYRAGRRAEWLLGYDWASLLPLPLEEVRLRLRVQPVASYEPIRDFQAYMRNKKKAA